MVDQELPREPAREAAVIGRRSLLAAGVLAPLAGLARAEAAADAPAGALERIRRRGRLSVAVYQDMPPFNVGGRGIDIDLAAALAEGLGVKPDLLPLHADESLQDDLRHAVWRGHYLGWGPADVMLHVPVDRPLIDSSPQVAIFAPYYRERVMLAWDRERGPQPESLAALQGVPVAVAGQSLAGWLLIGAEGGALRDGLSTRYADGAEAAQAVRDGRAAAAAGLASELQSVLADRSRYAIVPLPAPRAPRDGWAVGCAVKRDATDLAQALQQRVNELSADGRLRAIFQRHGVAWHG